MIKDVEVIVGGLHVYERGKLSFANDFDMSAIRRFYLIQQNDVNVVRAWQGHKVEKKWFFCVAGIFIINVIKIDNWDEPASILQVESFVLNVESPKVLVVPGGHVTGIKALIKDSSLMVFSDMNTQDSKDDDYRYHKNLWFNWNIE